jgi:hypothetical protein
MSNKNFCVLFLCIIQFCYILYLLFLHQSIILDCATHEIEPFIEKSISIIHNNNKLNGVAVSLLLHQPTWFQLRYTMMIQNINANIPDDWKIQIFYVNQGTSKSGISINLGLKRFLKSGKLILTEIPEAMFKRKKRRIEFMLEPWIWQNMLADKVLIFGGTSVICSNSPLSLSNFTNFDYIGAPWDHFKGLGGDGEISFRNRNLMLKIIENELLSYHENENGKKNRDEAYKSWGREDEFFVSRIIAIQKKQPTLVINLATREDTLNFAAIGGALHENVFAVSGTIPLVPFDARNEFLSLCPEMKMFYPVLHDPNCFGAQVNGTKCAASICALQGNHPGGC